MSKPSNGKDGSEEGWAERGFNTCLFNVSREGTQNGWVKLVGVARVGRSVDDGLFPGRQGRVCCGNLGRNNEVNASITRVGSSLSTTLACLNTQVLKLSMRLHQIRKEGVGFVILVVGDSLQVVGPLLFHQEHEGLNTGKLLTQAINRNEVFLATSVLELINQIVVDGASFFHDLADQVELLLGVHLGSTNFPRLGLLFVVLSKSGGGTQNQEAQSCNSHPSSELSYHFDHPVIPKDCCDLYSVQFEIQLSDARVPDIIR